jgi:hypothetical protein
MKRITTGDPNAPVIYEQDILIEDENKTDKVKPYGKEAQLYCDRCDCIRRFVKVGRGLRFTTSLLFISIWISSICLVYEYLNYNFIFYIPAGVLFFFYLISSKKKYWKCNACDSKYERD